ATVTGLPGGVAGNWAGNVVTISGTPTVSGTFNYTVTLTGGCGTAEATGTISVTPDNTITLTSAAGTDNQTVCINTAITNITYSTTGATGATVTGLPTGVTGSWASDVVTISGIPTESGMFDYKVELEGGCGLISSTGSITVNALPILVVTDPLPVCSPATVDITDPAVIAGSDPGLSISYWTDLAATIPYLTPITATNGTYYIKGTDDITGCYDIKPVNVVVNTSPSGTASATDVTCQGGSDGAVDLTVNTGTPPFSFLWSNGETSEDLSGVSAGTYSVIITDANNCTGLVSATVADGIGSPLNVTVSVVNVLCYGDLTGALDITVTGGTAPYSFLWSNGEISEDISGVPAGEYTVTVTDASGCIAVATETVSQPDAPINIDMVVSNVRCFGETNGSIDITVTNGTPPFTFLWNNGEVIEDITGLSEGTYTVTVTDVNGCTANKTGTVNAPSAPLSADAVVTNVLCYGESTGAIDITVSGGTSPYSFLWSNGAITEDLNNVPVGNYTVTITDANGCTYISGGDVTGPESGMTASVYVTNVLCNGANTGAIDLTVSGGILPYTFLWSNGETTEDISSVPAGQYSVTITDLTGCRIIQNAQITEPEKLSIVPTVIDASCPDTGDGSITLTITGGVPPYTVLWSDGITGTTRTTGYGIYTVIVTDINACAAELDIEVNFTGTNCLEIPEVITPNGDGKNDTWIIRNIEMYPNAEILVYNRWGKLIFKTKNPAANPWDGRYKGKLVPVDSYHYILYLNDGSKPRKGVITVIR
ncbi:MAG TPA: gliding motility-associated C-terminal domain-containing protein, partial [Bacteroidales bacterium]|nr:gliding motility-associated C-terminal domain-containing protein [Bacteroidales bacterium]